MKRKLLTLVLMLLLMLGFSSVANAAETIGDADVEGVYYPMYKDDAGNYYVKKTGADYYTFFGFADGTVAETLTVPSEFDNMPVKEFYRLGSVRADNLIVSEGITKIYVDTLRGLTTIKTIELPSTLEEIGSQAFYGTVLEELTIPGAVKVLANNSFEFSEIKKIILEEGITTINQQAFECASVESISLPSTLKEIGHKAFANTYSLKEVVIPDSVETLGSSAFWNSGIESVTVGSGIKIIYRTFEGCYNLKKVVLSEGLEEIDYYAFSGCVNIESINFPSTLKVIGECAFVNWGYNNDNLNELIIPEGVTTIGNNAFTGIGFKKVILPSTITSLGAYVVSGKVEEINIPIGMTSIPARCFFNANKLRTVTFDGNIKSIGDNAFAYCTSLENFEIPNTVEEIGMQAFYKCKLPQDLTIPSSVTIIGENGFNPIKNTYEYIPDYYFLKNVTVNGKIKRIEYATFANQQYMESIILPDTLEFIDENVFANCISLTSIKVPSKVKILSSNLFTNCINLKTVNLPEGLTTINSGAFNQCTSLTSITIPASVTTIDASAFTNCTNFTTIYGVKGSVAETFAKENNLKFVEFGITKVETEEVKNEEGKTVTAMPITPDNTVDSFINEENFPGLADGTNEAVIKDADGNVKSASEGIGSKNVIQIVDKATGTVIAEYTVVVRGDITGEGKARIFDAYEILKDAIIKTATDYAEIDKLIRDYDGDGKVRIFDAYSYLRDSIL